MEDLMYEPDCQEPKWRMRVSYDGRQFLGWQRQPQGLTVQEALETALATALRHPVACEGAGRTDTGVHGRGQVTHFRSSADIDPKRLEKSLQGLLPKGVAIRDLERAPDDFSSRYSALWREYCYRIRTRHEPLETPNVWVPRMRCDLEAISEALSWFGGRHDFESFCIPRDDGRHTMCTLLLAQAVRTTDGVDLWIRGDRFLHRMVRSIVGFCVDVSRGHFQREHLERMLAGDRCDPRFWAPPDGLTLERVGYPDWTEKPIRGQPDAGQEWSSDQLVLRGDS
jgi:tRNA pseudouridine38-40 synthase